jgi:hypothetical protein
VLQSLASLSRTRVAVPRIPNPSRGATLVARGARISAATTPVHHASSLLLFPLFALESRIVAMNFVDVQPKSFLDYAWTSPSPTALTAVKSSKTSRKQNRCCDQCRKGKRACDAAILEDALLDDNKGGANPPAFHYSGECH